MPLPRLVQISRSVARRVDFLRLGPPVTHVYNPLLYARRAHEEYLERYGHRHPQALLLGMNPGPWGMAQTGVPFGTVDWVRDWLGIEQPVKAPRRPHPRRPVLGFSCTRQEVSGKRLWGWAQERFKEPTAFSRRFFIWNYCPLAFFDAAGRNVTPDKLKRADRTRLFEACDRGLQEIVKYLEPRFVVGVGKFAEARARDCLQDYSGRVGGILHPSPASPLANRGWAQQAEAQLRRLGVKL